MHKSVFVLAALVSLVVCGAGHADTWVINGTIITPASTMDSGSVVVTGQMISAVGAAVSSPRERGRFQSAVSSSPASSTFMII